MNKNKLIDLVDFIGTWLSWSFVACAVFAIVMLFVQSMLEEFWGLHDILAFRYASLVALFLILVACFFESSRNSVKRLLKFFLCSMGRALESIVVVMITAACVIGVGLLATVLYYAVFER